MKQSTVIEDKNIIKKVTGKEVNNPTDCCSDPIKKVVALMLSWYKGLKRDRTELITVCCFKTFGLIDTKYFDEIDRLNNYNFNKKDLIDYLDIKKERNK
jgi:hypothetical protein